MKHRMQNLKRTTLDFIKECNEFKDDIIKLNKLKKYTSKYLSDIQDNTNIHLNEITKTVQDF